jgi:hypothetical protein
MSMSLPIAALGASALYALFAWMASAIAASQLSGEKGFGERIGLACGLVLAPIGLLIWLIVPGKPISDWKVRGPSTAAIVILALSLVIGIAGLVAVFVGDMSTALRVLVGLMSALFVAFSIVGLAAARKGGTRSETATPATA